MWLALSLTLSLAAQPAAELDEGKRLYFDLEYELAVFRFRDATRNEALPASERALAFAWLGLAYAQVAEMESAKEAFVDAARLYPEVTLPPEASPPPKAVQLLEEAKAEVRASPPPTAPSSATGPGAPAAAETVPSAAAESGPLGPLLLGAGGVVGGLGVLSLAGGGVAGLVALNAAQEGNAAEFQDDAAALKERAEGAALGANLLFLGGGALVVAGAAALAAGWLVE